MLTNTSRGGCVGVNRRLDATHLKFSASEPPIIPSSESFNVQQVVRCVRTFVRQSDRRILSHKLTDNTDAVLRDSGHRRIYHWATWAVPPAPLNCKKYRTWPKIQP